LAFPFEENHHHPHPHPRPVPEVSSGWVLLPAVLAVLAFSTRQMLRRREAQN